MLVLAAVVLGAAAWIWLRGDALAPLISEMARLGILPTRLCASSLHAAVALARATRRLRLRGRDLASPEVQAALRPLEQLEAFLVEDCTLEVNGFQQLRKALESCSEVAFLRCPLGALPSGLVELAPRALRPRGSAAPQRTHLAMSLVALDLSANRLTGSGRTLALLLRHCNQLALLQLDDCALSLEDLSQLARALARSRLERLDLAGNALRREGLLAVARSLPSSHVQDLGLERNGIVLGDALSELKRAHDKRPFPGLRLQGNRLSSAEQRAFLASLQAATSRRLAGAFCPPGCKCFEGRGEVM
ncbi:Nlrp14 [Symbiodinium natans]|uniref:Nlrp14 protein n=1 Tax=Symbiodinium natans TaxID=878477 RepID=A0A812MZM3_9DINO|nr:Nlrp14 [Symbiodinium natans]